MAQRDLSHRVGFASLLEPQNIAGVTTKSAILDTEGFDGVDIVVGVGAVTGEDAGDYMTISLQESDDTTDAHFTNVDPTCILGGPQQSGDTFYVGGPETGYPDIANPISQGNFWLVNAAGDINQIQRAGYVGKKRYVRAVLTFTGTGITASSVHVMAAVGYGRREPIVPPALITAS